MAKEATGHPSKAPRILFCRVSESFKWGFIPLCCWLHFWGFQPLGLSFGGRAQTCNHNSDLLSEWKDGWVEEWMNGWIICSLTKFIAESHLLKVDKSGIVLRSDAFVHLIDNQLLLLHRRLCTNVCAYAQCLHALARQEDLSSVPARLPFHSSKGLSKCRL